MTISMTKTGKMVFVAKTWIPQWVRVPIPDNISYDNYLPSMDSPGNHTFKDVVALREFRKLDRERKIR